MRATRLCVVTLPRATRPAPTRGCTGPSAASVAHGLAPAPRRQPAPARAGDGHVPHRRPLLDGEPDADLGSGGRLDIIPSYVAVRGEEGLLVRVDLDRTFYGDDFAWELYRYQRPWEDTNVFKRQHDKRYVRQLKRRLLAWVDCGPKQCRRLTR